MKDKKEFLVGLFILSSVIILAIFLLTFDKLKLKNKYYLLKVKFNDVNNLEIGTPVLLGGVKVGKVEKIYLLENDVIVEVYIKRVIKIRKKARITITLKGLIGDLILNIYNPSTGEDYFEEGDILKGIDPISLNVLTEKLYITMGLLEDIGRKVNNFSFKDGEEVFTNINKISKNLDQTITKTKEVMENTNELIIENKKNLNDIAENGKRLIDNLNSVLDKNNNNLNELVLNFLEITNEMKQMLDGKDEDVEEIVINLKIVTEKVLSLLEKLEKTEVDEKGKEISKVIDNLTDITEDVKIKLKETDNKKIQKSIENTEEITTKIKKILNNKFEIIPEIEMGNTEKLNANLNFELLNTEKKYYLKLAFEKIGMDNNKNKIFIGKKIKSNKIGFGIINNKPALDYIYNYNNFKLNFNYYDLKENNLEIKTSMFLENNVIYLKYDLEKIFYIGAGYRF